MTLSSSLSSNTNVEILLNTLAHEKHARYALLVAFLEELRAAVTEEAPDSTRELLSRAGNGEMSDADVDVLIDEVRAFVTAA